jgi:hypothetical protein
MFYKIEEKPETENHLTLKPIYLGLFIVCIFISLFIIMIGIGVSLMFVDFNPKFDISLIILNSKIYNETGDYEEAIAVESSGKSFKNHN